MKKNEIIEKIKKFNWDFRVSRTGFLQSQSIVDDAIIQNTISLVGSIEAHYENIVWVQEKNFYDEDASQSFYGLFEQAFKIDTDWPLAIIDYFKKITEEKDSFIASLDRDWNAVSAEEKVKVLREYAETLKRIQKYYVIAYSLTKHCEDTLREIDEDLLMYGESYEMLDVAKHTSSLVALKDSGNDEKLIEEHLKKYCWIKVAYNILDEYTKEDVIKELESTVHIEEKKEIPDHPQKHLIVGLQVGIFTRNRMKEMSQQMWFAIEPLGRSLAKDFGISRDDFFQLSVEEVEKTQKNGELTVGREELDARDKGYVLGYLDNERIYFVGPEVEELYSFFHDIDTTGIESIEGTTACKGNVKGVARVVKDRSELGKLQEGEILVTTMTTPDFVVGMKIAGAIVTDEGGLSCHAAIVSRELKIPCIIGTKIATKVLKDGDMVEVDANTGIVKRIKK